VRKIGENALVHNCLKKVPVTRLKTQSCMSALGARSCEFGFSF
jgi:hypothetical protein